MATEESVLDRFNRIGEEITGGDVSKLSDAVMTQISVIVLGEIHGSNRDFSVEEIAEIQTRFFTELGDSIEEDALAGDPKAQMIEDVVESIMQKMSEEEDE